MTAFALITGAARGIGKAVAGELAAAGWRLALLDMDADELAAVAAELGERGHTAHTIVADLASLNAIQSALAQVRALGPVCGLVNNAALLGPVCPAADLDVADWDTLLAVNLRAPWLLCRGLYPDLVRTKGAVVNVSSTAGKDGSPTLLAYAVSKAGLIGLTRTLAKEWAPDGIRVNGVAPGLVESQMSAKLRGEQTARLLAAVPMARMGQSEEIAKVIRMLLSQETSFVTGQTWNIDGGRLPD